MKPLQSPGIFSMLPVKISAKPIFFCWPVLKLMPRRQCMGIRKYDRMEDIMADIDIKDKDVYIIPFGGSVMPQTEADYARFSEEI